MTSEIQLVQDAGFSPVLGAKGVRYYHIYTVAGQQVGYVYFVPDPQLAKQTGNIGYFVELKHRRQGVATQALTQLIEMVRQQGRKTCTIHLAKDNDTSRGVVRRVLAGQDIAAVETCLPNGNVCIHMTL